MEHKSKFYAGLAIGLGIVLAGWFLGSAVRDFRLADRSVSVRGLAEREVKADKVLWPLVYTETGNDLSAIYSAIEAKNKKVLSFLTSGGISADEITVAAPSVIDVEANQYSDNKRGVRYIVTQVVTVSSGLVDKVIELRGRQTELMKQNIGVTGDIYQYPTQFLFTSLNDIKPAMIEEATKNARASAEKFAQDSDSDLGRIKSATQGQVLISDRDQYSPQIKSVRVTTTIVYSLEN